MEDVIGHGDHDFTSGFLCPTHFGVPNPEHSYERWPAASEWISMNIRRKSIQFFYANLQLTPPKRSAFCFLHSALRFLLSALSPQLYALFS
jgi:hypothetical protein